ncbi:hypothetical protein [Paenibacillus lemnae]|nr:hypothetical protein [Paenibacillus lemnae]
METYKMQINTRKNLLSLAAAVMLVIYAGLLLYRGGILPIGSKW